MTAHGTSPQPLTARRAGRLHGVAEAPGDKSLSHRALLFGGLAVGETRVSGLLEGADVLATAEALRRLGCTVTRDAPGAWRVQGVGVGGFHAPDDVIDCGNSGTSARLLMGAIAASPITAMLTGDASLRRRPMRRVIEPLSRMGAAIAAREGQFLPLTITGAEPPLPIVYRLPVPSAQVKSAILLAGLAAPGETTVIEAEPTRDHTERLLAAMGATIRIAPAEGGGTAITLTGEPELRPLEIDVPGDPSSAAFLVVAACIVPGSDVVVRNVLMNPTRTGLIVTLREMGASIETLAARDAGGEPVADLRIRHAPLQGVVVPAGRAPSMIDEYPVLAVAAAFAEGTSVMHGLAELRVKESDRLAAVASGLAANSVTHRAGEDWLEVDGRGADGVPGGGVVATHLDHRIAMSFLVMGLASAQPVTVDDGAMIATSFPAFVPLMRTLGADIT